MVDSERVSAGLGRSRTASGLGGGSGGGGSRTVTVTRKARAPTVTGACGGTGGDHQATSGYVCGVNVRVFASAHSPMDRPRSDHSPRSEWGRQSSGVQRTMERGRRGWCAVGDGRRSGRRGEKPQRRVRWTRFVLELWRYDAGNLRWVESAQRTGAMEVKRKVASRAVVRGLGRCHQTSPAHAWHPPPGKHTAHWRGAWGSQDAQAVRQRGAHYTLAEGKEPS
ncbi:hypothetical protein C8Q79DRAFT_569753 [Trametes meyenii]|nr:hypothetical protein C8Q79DRAFT_569753 [Trametes meyenii]